MMQSGEMTTLEAEIRELRTRVARCAHHLADIGDQLLRARELVPDGEWTAWLGQRVDFTRQTARHYMDLALLRRDDPARFEAVTAQGLRAAYRVNGLPAPACPAPAQAASRIERLANAVSCIRGAPPEDQKRALDAIERLRTEVLRWTESSRVESA